MPYTPVTWAAGELVTSTKLNAMVGNELFCYKGFSNTQWSGDEEHQTNNTDYQERERFKLVVPPGAVERGELTIHCMMTCSAGQTASFKFEIDDDSIDVVITSTSASYEFKSGTLDISGISAGAKTAIVWLKVSNSAGIAKVKNVHVVISPES